MAGSGKTTLMQRILSDCQLNNTAAYCLNLDPAVGTLPYQANIDIRDTVNYKQVMKQYNLGPNGGILTSLNLFATRFDQVLGFVDKRAPELDLVLLDTPGQIEIFTWSASGTIITESLASTYPSIILYVVDTPRTTSPVTFMSNMMYATSIMYKSKLPFLLVFNKTDVTSHEFAVNWMNDFDAFAAALKSDDSYMSSLTRSMSLVLAEFYATIRAVGVSAVSGEGMPKLFEAIQDLTVEYNEVYAPALAQQKVEVEAKAAARKEKQLAKMKREMAADENLQRGETIVLDGGKAAKQAAGSSSSSSGGVDKKKSVGGSMGTLDPHSLIQTRSTTVGQSVRHPDEEELEESDDDGEGGRADRFPDEDDAEANGLPYDEDDREEDASEYVDPAAEAKDRNDFDEFMAKLQRRDGQTATVIGKKPTAASKPIEEGDEEEIDAAATSSSKYCGGH